MKDKETQLQQLKAQLQQIENDLIDPNLDLGNQEIFVLNARRKLREKIERLEK